MPDKDVMRRWSTAAPLWDKHREVIRQMFAPVTQALIDEAQIGPGCVVLDIATGPGEPALSIASVVGSEGLVVGVDPIPEMVAAGRRAAEHQGLRNARFEVAFSDHLPFPADTFDAVVSRFGIMFAPLPVDATREMLRVLRPRGRFALAVWAAADENPFFSSISRVVEQYVATPPAEPDALDAFRFADPGKLRDLLRAADLGDPCERSLQFTIEGEISVEEFWRMRCEMSEKLREALAGLSSEQMAELERQSLDALRPYATNRGMRFPGEVLIVSGTKNGTP